MMTEQVITPEEAEAEKKENERKIAVCREVLGLLKTKVPDKILAVTDLETVLKYIKDYAEAHTWEWKELNKVQSADERMKEMTIKPADRKRAWVARRVLDLLNKKTDEKLLSTGALGEMLVFLRRFVQPIVLTIGPGGLLEKHFHDTDWHGLKFETRKIVIEGMPIETTIAFPAPDFWEWSTKDQVCCQQIFKNLRTIDVLINDDVLRACRTELQTLTDRDTVLTRDIRLMTDDELKERVNIIKKFDANYWIGGPWRPGRYCIASKETEDKRALQRQLENARGNNIFSNRVNLTTKEVTTE